MADTATPPANPPADPANPPANPPAPKPPKPAKPAEPPAQPAYLTAEQAEEMFTRRLAEREAEWEKTRVGQLEDAFRKNYEIPKRRDSKIAALREELKAASKYLPADDDISDPTSPGDLAALTDLDDERIVAKDAKGNGLTRLDVELKRTKDRLNKRTPLKKGDNLATPPAVPGGPDEFAAQRESVKAKHEAAAANARRPLPFMAMNLPRS